jgi:hypothetical protein
VLRIDRDLLGFEVTSDRAGYLHVLLLGPDGQLLLFYPNARASDNRIEAGRTVSLPQASWGMRVTEPAGREDFLVIVTAQPRDYGHLARGRADHFTILPTGAAGAEARARWASASPLLLGRAASCAVAGCDDYGAARFSIDIVR